MNVYEELKTFGFETESSDAVEVLDGFRPHLEEMYEKWLTATYLENHPKLRLAAELLEFGDFVEVLQAGRLLAQHVQEENEFWERAELEEMNSY